MSTGDLTRDQAKAVGAFGIGMQAVAGELVQAHGRDSTIVDEWLQQASQMAKMTFAAFGVDYRAAVADMIERHRRHDAGKCDC